MTEHVRQQDSLHIDNVDVDHEHRDINVRAVLWVAFGLVVTAVVVHVAVWGLFRYFDSREAARKQRAFPLAAIETQLPPEPRIQARPAEDLANLRRREDEVLSTYGWVDQNAGIARIPITEAMKLVVERGLPAREAPRK